MFDIIVSNPPYINISKVKSKKYLKDKFNVGGSIDLGTLFYYVAYDYLHENGVVCYVTSNKWLSSLSGVLIRRFIKENFRVVRIVNTYRVRLFEAHMEVCIILALKERRPKDYEIEVKVVKPRIGYRWCAVREEGYRIPDTQLTDRMWHLEPPEVMSIYYKIQKMGTPISRWPVKITTGIRLRKYVSEIVTTSQRSRDWVGIIKGRDIQKYFHKPPSIWLPKGVIPAVSGIDNKYRIVFPKLNAELGFALAESYIHSDETAYIMELTDYYEDMLYYLLAILNSKFFDRCFRKFYAGGGIEGEVKIYALKQFPIPKIENNRSISRDIIGKVKMVYEHGDIKYKDEIEALVLELYDLYSAYWYIYS